MIFTGHVESQAAVNETSEDPVKPFLKLKPEGALFKERTNARITEKRDVLLQNSMIS